jgi:competence protein ComEA
MLGFNKSTSSRAADRLQLAMDQWKIQPVTAPPAQRNRVEPSSSDTASGQSPGLRFNVPWTPRAIKALIAIATALVVVIGFMWWSARPIGELAPLDVNSSIGLELSDESSDTFAPVVVHVAGAVKSPGLYELAPGSRVADAITAAGGVTKKSAADSVNLARELVDGEQISVGGASSSGSKGISINSSSATELEALPGVGPVLAARIVAHRESNGPFKTIDDLGDVSGIGSSILGQIRGQATL